MDRLLFFGTPAFAAKTLRFVLDHNFPVVGVVTQPPRPRPSAVAEVAQQEGLPLFDPPKVSTPEMAEQLRALGADIFLVVAYGEILRKMILEIPPKGCINVHASLLPKYRGAAPMQRALMSGEKETGVTIMHMVREMDAGNIIKAASVSIGPDTNLPELEEQLCNLGCQLLLEVLPNITPGTPQKHEEATFAPKIEPAECQIDWSRPAHEIHNLIRGVAGRPGAWSWVEIRGRKKRVKIHRSRLSSKGELELLELQLEGKRALSAEEFFRGATEMKFL